MKKNPQGRPKKAQKDQVIVCSVSFSPKIFLLIKGVKNRSKFIESCIIDTVNRKTNGNFPIL